MDLMKAILFGVFLCTLLPLSANDKDINAVLVALECYANQTPSYIEKSDHIFNDTTQTSVLKIIKHTLYRNQNLFTELHFNWKDKKIISGTLRIDSSDYKLVLIRQGNQIKSIDIKGTSFGRHLLEYNEFGQVVKVIKVERPGTETRRFYEIVYNEDNKISQILYVLSNPKENKRALYTDKSFSYNGNECKIHIDMYSGIHTRRFVEKIYKTEDVSYQVIPEKRKYITKVEKNKVELWTTESTYNDKNQRVLFVDTNNDSKRVALKTIVDEYDEDLLVKTIDKTYVDNKLKDHSVKVWYKIDPSTNEYVPIKKDDTNMWGYSENGEVILESKLGRNIFRSKKNGSWGKWTYNHI